MHKPLDSYLEGEHVASFRDMTARASKEMVNAHNTQLNYISERLMPDNYNHTADSGTHH